MVTRRARPSAAMVALTTVLLALAGFAAPAEAEVTAADAWVRGTVAAQGTTGAYMFLRATETTTLVGASSPVAGMAMLHAMALEKGVMKMRDASGLVLPAGKTVELKPGGHHVMLMDLDHPLREGERVPIVLTLKDAAGRESRLTVQATVRPLTAPSAPSAPKAPAAPHKAH